MQIHRLVWLVSWYRIQYCGLGNTWGVFFFLEENYNLYMQALSHNPKWSG